MTIGIANNARLAGWTRNGSNVVSGITATGGTVTTITDGGYTWTLHTLDRKSTRLNSSHIPLSRMPSSA